MGTPEKITLGYIAGQIDSSSAVGFYDVKGVEVGMVKVRRRDPWMLKVIKSHWGGHISETKNAYELTIAHEKAATFLKELLPFMVTKKSFAQQIIDAYNPDTSMNNGDKPVFPGGETESGLAADGKGLTKREHFAGLAMQGLLTIIPKERAPMDIEKQVAKMAVDCADELLKRLGE